VSIVARNEGFFALDLAENGPDVSRAIQSRDQRLSLAGSTILHGLALALLILLAPQHGTERAGKGLGLVPVEVELDWNRSAPSDASTQATLTPAGGAPEAPPVADALATKLEALAKLRAPSSGTWSAEDGSRAATMLPSSASSPGQKGMYGLKDFILDQVVRRWNLNLANLKGADYSVPIRVKVARNGEVLKAEVMDSPYSGDPFYNEVAISARNAVLASSPLALPAGQHDDVMDMVLYLDPKATMH
jgi:hypothetical protein